jgi:acyl-CoA synthetase (AMP-forming)/AMP-acid ligase II
MIMSSLNLSPAALLTTTAAQRPDVTALIYEDREVSFGDLAARVRRVAAGLAAGGVRRGDRVAYLGLNSAVLLETLFAASHLGAVFLPVNFRLAGAEVAHILRDAGAHTLVVEDGHRELVESIAGEIPVRRHVRAGDVDDLDGPEASTPAPSRDDDLAVLMYTSGSTGLPKGVMLTVGNLWWNNVNVQTALDLLPGDVTFAAAPLFHIGGLNAFTLGTLLRGGTVVLRRGFDPVQALADIVRHRVTSVFGVPAMFAALRRAPGFDDADLSALRAALVAGAPVPPALVRDYLSAGVNLQQAWGLTETAPFATYLPARLTEAKAGSAGFPMPYTRVRLVDPADGTPISAPGTPGEVCVRGPNVTPGYWARPEATAEAFDAEGWFHTGDVGILDADGCLSIVDRIKDMIITGGENVFPAEVERVLSAHPDVLDVAVVGVPDPRWGETVVAVLATKPDADLELAAVREYGGEHLARYKLPTAVLHLDPLPRNGSGKLDKPSLRAWVREQAGEQYGRG